MGMYVDIVNATTQGMERGELKGRISGLRQALAEWKEYAEGLEREVKFYRSEAVKGWAGYEVAKQLMKREIGKAPTEFEEFSQKVKEQQKEQEEFYEKQ